MTEILLTIFGLLVFYQVKHYLADYLLQGKYMLGKFKENGWELPLAAHCGVHAAMTMFVAVIMGMSFWVVVALTLFDFISHFVIDKIKVELSRNHTPKDAKFWYHLGLDQMAHHLVHYNIIMFIVMRMFGL
ncbi:conserved hypothetical protein [Aeromonas phage 65]|uniref:DUF3307 domain-containing protein n=2 Tax=Ishigurovirus osborne TaxID=260149 RepID=E5DSD2_9CAUD|nr:membrane protein [Aeromonas phage 65]ADQ53306.1 conserved hypothetical protein [Aeromonas phage 65]